MKLALLLFVACATLVSVQGTTTLGLLKSKLDPKLFGTQFEAWLGERIPKIPFMDGGSVDPKLTALGFRHIPTPAGRAIVNSELNDIRAVLNANLSPLMSPTKAEYEDAVDADSKKAWKNSAETGATIAAHAKTMKPTFVAMMKGIETTVNAGGGPKTVVFSAGSGAKYAAKSAGSLTEKTQAIRAQVQADEGVSLTPMTIPITDAPAVSKAKMTAQRKKREKVRELIRVQISKINDGLRGTFVVTSIAAMKKVLPAFKAAILAQFPADGKMHVYFDSKYAKASVKATGYMAIHAIFQLKHGGVTLICEAQFHFISVNDLSSGCPKEEAHKVYEIVRAAETAKLGLADKPAELAKVQGLIDQANGATSLAFLYGFEHISDLPAALKHGVADKRSKREAAHAKAVVKSF